MMRFSLLILILTFTSFGGEKSWPGVKFTEVKAFHWPVKMDTESLIDKNFKLLPGVVNKAGVKLNKTQILSLRKSVIGKHPEHDQALCYIPHNAFIFYNGNKPVAFIEVCFDCLGYRAFPKSKAENFDILSIAKICKQLKIPFGKYKSIQHLEKLLKRK